jgi:hypothetical protein
MSSNVVRISDRAAAPRGHESDDYLGPAAVVRVHGHEIHVVLPGSDAGAEGVPATMALAFPYEPAVGDDLLVVGKGGAFYVIGVLQGAGRTVFNLPGDVGLHAGGALHLSGAKGVRVDGPEIEMNTGKLRMVADAVVQRFTSVYQRVSEMLSVHAGESHLLVDEASYTQAKTAAIVTEETVTINGDEVHLG